MRPLLLLALASQAFAAYPEVDFFHRPSVGSHWTQTGNWQISSNQLFTNTSTTAYMQWSSANPTTGSFSRVQHITNSGSGGTFGMGGAAFMMSGANRYECLGSPSNGILTLRKVIGATVTVLASAGVGFASGDFAEGVDSGGSLTCKGYVGGGPSLRGTLTASDSTIASGGVGVSCSGCGSGNLLYGWAGGNSSDTHPPMTLAGVSTSALKCLGGVGSFYISPSASNAGPGSFASPLSVSNFLGLQATLPSGFHGCVMGGLYQQDYTLFLEHGSFTITAHGSVSAQSTLEVYPGQVATFDAAISCNVANGTPVDVWFVNGQQAGGQFMTFLGWYEITNSDTSCKVIPQCGSNPTNTPIQGIDDTSTGGNIYAFFVIHDTSNAFGSEASSIGGTVANTLIFNIGQNEPDRTHGHCTYIQNSSGGPVKTFIDDILNRCYVNGMRTFTATVASQCENTNWQYVAQIGPNDLRAECGAISHTTYNGVMLYQSSADFNIDDTLASNFTWTNNILDGSIRINQVSVGTVQNNIVSCSACATQDGGMLVQFYDSPYNTFAGAYSVFDNNTYFKAPIGTNSFFTFTHSGTETGTNFAGWQALGADTHGSYNSTVWPASGATPGTGAETNRIVVRASTIDPARGNAIIYNWKRTATVALDISSIVGVGHQYQIVDAQCWSCGAIVTGTYAGGTISMPMNQSVIQVPTGNYQADPGNVCAPGSDGGTPTPHPVPNFTHTQNNEFGAFMITDLTVELGASISISPATLSTATVGTAYGQTLTATGGTGPYTFAITSGTLPPGPLVLSSGGVISGIPNGCNTYPATPCNPALEPLNSTFTVTATDNLGNTGSATYTLGVYWNPTEVAYLATQQTNFANMITQAGGLATQPVFGCGLIVADPGWIQTPTNTQQAWNAWVDACHGAGGAVLSIEPNMHAIYTQGSAQLTLLTGAIAHARTLGMKIVLRPTTSGFLTDCATIIGHAVNSGGGTGIGAVAPGVADWYACLTTAVGGLGGKSVMQWMVANLMQTGDVMVPVHEPTTTAGPLGWNEGIATGGCNNTAPRGNTCPDDWVQNFIFGGGTKAVGGTNPGSNNIVAHILAQAVTSGITITIRVSTFISEMINSPSYSATFATNLASATGIDQDVYFFAPSVITAYNTAIAQAVAQSHPHGFQEFGLERWCQTGQPCVEAAAIVGSQSCQWESPVSNNWINFLASFFSWAASTNPDYLSWFNPSPLAPCAASYPDNLQNLTVVANATTALIAGSYSPVYYRTKAMLTDWDANATVGGKVKGGKIH